MEAKIDKLRFRQFSIGDKITITAITLFVAIVALCVSTVLLFISLMGRPLHGAPPSSMVFAIPIIVTILAALAAGFGSCRLFARKYPFPEDKNKAA